MNILSRQSTKKEQYQYDVLALKPHVFAQAGKVCIL